LSLAAEQALKSKTDIARKISLLYFIVFH